MAGSQPWKCVRLSLEKNVESWETRRLCVGWHTDGTYLVHSKFRSGYTRPSRAGRLYATMKLRHVKTLAAPGNKVNKVTALAWSPNGMRLAVCKQDRIVYLYDDQGERKEKFGTRGANPKAPKTYYVTGMCFSPDSSRLAIAQSDNIVFVYRVCERTA